MNMTPGANATVPSQTLTIRIQSGMAVDASAFRLYDTGKVKNDADMVFMVKQRMMIKPLAFVLKATIASLPSI